MTVHCVPCDATQGSLSLDNYIEHNPKYQNVPNSSMKRPCLAKFDPEDRVSFEVVFGCEQVNNRLLQ